MTLEPKDTQAQNEMMKWRRHFHEFPETAFEEFATSDYIAARLEEFGLEFHRGLGKTGIVATLKNGEGPSIALRADMDGLHMHEENKLSYASKHEGKMHGCGHDGHMAMLMGAAKKLSENPEFNGTVQFIFQPAEENEGGAEAMIKEGLFEKFPVDYVFGLHNWPEMPLGTMALQPGPMMAAADRIHITIEGKGAHGAMPHLGIDPVVVAAQAIMGLQTISSRQTNPQDAVVVSITQFEAGHSSNVIPQSVHLKGTVRSFDERVRDQLPEQIEQIVQGTCKAYGATASIDYIEGYPATINEETATELCKAAAMEVFEEANIITKPTPSMGAEDFAYMLKANKGCYVWLGTGGMPGGCLLHNPGYDFNDEALTLGMNYWVSLVKSILK